MKQTIDRACTSEMMVARRPGGELAHAPGKSINPQKWFDECKDRKQSEASLGSDVASESEKALAAAEQEIEIVKAGAEEVFEERVASLEEKVAELTQLLEALQTQ